MVLASWLGASLDNSEKLKLSMVISISAFSKSSVFTFLADPLIEIFRALAADLILESGGFPWWVEIVPAESMVILSLKPSFSTIILKVASAAGDRQIFPQQTNKICITFHGILNA